MGTDKRMLPSDWALSLTASIAIIFSIVGFLGNFITIAALPYVKKLRNASTWFVINLALTELTFCITILPMSAAHILHLRFYKKSLFDDNACKVFVFLRFVLIQAELLSIAAVALNRCILIANPSIYSRIFTIKKTLWYMIFIWGYSIIIMLGPLCEIYGSFAFNVHTQECDFAETDTGPKKLYLAVGFLFPSCVIIVSYSYIFYKARQSGERIRRTIQEPSKKKRPAEGLRNRDMRVARTIGVIFLSFIICCSPVSLVHFYGSEGDIPNIFLLLHPLYWLQYCINVLIYVLMNKQYKDAYITFIALWCPKFKTITERYEIKDETSTTPQTAGTGSERNKI